jgi:hypothetical protein
METLPREFIDVCYAITENNMSKFRKNLDILYKSKYTQVSSLFFLSARFNRYDMIKDLIIAYPNQRFPKECFANMILATEVKNLLNKILK